MRISHNYGGTDGLCGVVMVSSGVIFANDFVSHDGTSMVINNWDNFALLGIDMSVRLSRFV